MNNRHAKNYYQILGIKPEDSALEVKRAYRKLAKSHHPDVVHAQNASNATESVHSEANEFMARVNEAYETLIDKRRRAEYDSIINAFNRTGSTVGKFTDLNEGENHEIYLRQNFHPSRTAMVKVLNRYNQELRDLSDDIYDDELVAVFERYVDEVENVLRKSSQTLSARSVPRTLDAAVTMMRFAIAQAVDGLDEMRRFCQNYDYDHLHMAGNLFREANNLSRQGLQLTKT